MEFKKDDSYETMLELVARAAWREFDRPRVYAGDGTVTDPGFDARVIGTFQNAVIMEDEGTDVKYEVAYMLNGDSVIFGQPKEVTTMYVEKRMDEAGLEYPTKAEKSVDDVESIEVAGPIVRKNAALRIGYAAVLVPGEPDSDGEILTADKIEEVSHGWMESYRNVDLMHTLNNTGVPVESYILPEAMKVTAYGEPMELPAGSWILASKLSEEAWAAVESGVLTGYSVMGIKRAHLTTAMKSEEGVLDESAFKRTLLEDLGPDWVASHVSVVDHPAVPKAKFFALKSKEFSDEEIAAAVVKATEESPSFLVKLGKALGFSPKSAPELPEEVEDVAVDDVTKSEDDTELVSAEKAGRKLSAVTLKKLEDCKKSIMDCHSQLDAIISGIDEADDTNNEPASQDSGAPKSVSTEETSEGPVTDMDEAQLQAIVAEAVKSAVEPLTSRLDALEAAPKSEAPEVEIAVAEVTEEPVAEKAAEDEATPEEIVEKAEATPEVEEVTEEIAEKAIEPVTEPVVEEPVVEKSEELEIEEVPEAVKSEEEIAAEETAKKAEEEAAAEDAAFKSKLVEALDKIEQLEKRVGRVAVTSNALKNDGSGSPVDDSTDDSGRDAFGRRIR